MTFISTLLAGIAFPAPPTFMGGLVWVSLMGALVYALFHWKTYQTEWMGRDWGLFLAFFILIPITNLFIGVRLTPISTRPLPGLPADPQGSALMLFSAIPWLLGGSLLGPIGAAVLGAFAGLVRGAWDTYSLFPMLEIATLGAWFSVNMRQRFHTQAYTWLRQPVVGALLLIPFHVLFYVISSLFTQWGLDASAPVTAHIDFAMSNLYGVTLAFGGEMLVGGLVVQIISKAFPTAWGGKQGKASSLKIQDAVKPMLEAILNSTPDPALVTDHRNRLLLTNRAASVALGQDVSKSIGMETEKIVELKPLLALLQGKADAPRQSAEVILADKHTYLATASSVVMENQQTWRICIMRDVTHFKELDTMKSEFVATVSHDLRSPLTLMRGYATMLEMVGELNDQQQGYVKKIISGVENMSRLVNNLLDLGRIDLGVGLQVEQVNVFDIIERVTSTLQLQAAQKNIDLSVELSKDMPHAVEADQALLYQAVYNLLENAIKYTPVNGRVTLGTSSQPGYLIFTVADSGIGIAAEDMPRLFEKFYRGKQREARAQQGSGLGLAMVHSIAESHGGRIWVNSVVGQGSTFHLLIPLTQPKGV